jgi:two-component sensor histidine kinase
MAPKPTSEPISPGGSSPILEHAPIPMATVEGATHLVRYINPAFCRLIDKAADEVVGHPFCELLPDMDECAALLDRVYHSGKSSSHTMKEAADPRPVFTSYIMWPVMTDGRTVGVTIQVIEAGSLHEKTLVMNEALLLGALRQHELTEAADSSNILLQTEIGIRKQRERDALMLTQEISHRIKNNLQIVGAMIASEARQMPAQYAQGYIAMQARIGAIAKLYDLISQSSRGPTIPVDAYLREIATSMAASLLGNTSGISIEVQAEALDIDPDRAVPFGLVVNELGTNAIKHAFPDGIGRLILGAKRIGDQIELTVADSGVGMAAKDQATPSGTHGSDYVAIFVRQLGGTMAVSGAEGTGTIVSIRLPLFAAPSAVAGQVGT